MIVSFVIVIGILILIHELGHFLVARWTGVGVERFSIGFGPVLLRWRGKDTEYCLSAIPMGGYVKMLGEESPLEGGTALPYDPKKAFALKPIWARFLIVFAGPGMNFVLAALIVAVVLATVGRPVWPAVVGRVAENSAAAAAGLKSAEAAGLRSGDVVISIGGRRVYTAEDLVQAIRARPRQTVPIEIEREGRRLTLSVTPNAEEEKSAGGATTQVGRIQAGIGSKAVT